MSFAPKIDYYGFSTQQELKVLDSTEGKSNQTVTAVNEEGSVAQSETFGITYAPSNSYKVTKCWTTDGLEIVLGGTTTVDTYSGDSLTSALSNVTIGTSAGSEPSMSASGEMCYTGSTALPPCAMPCTYTIFIYGLSPKRHAQILTFKFKNAEGTDIETCPLVPTDETSLDYVDDGYLTQSDYDITSTIGRATVNGDTVAVDVTEGQITCTFTITGKITTTTSGTTAQVPDITINEDDGWKITQPLTCTDPDANFPSWTIGCTYYLPKKDPEEDTASNS